MFAMNKDDFRLKSFIFRLKSFFFEGIKTRKISNIYISKIICWWWRDE